MPSLDRFSASAPEHSFPSSAGPCRDQAFDEAIEKALLTPLTALRASVEGIVSELRGRARPPAAIAGVLAEIDRLTQNVQSLMEYSGDICSRPLDCSLREILRTATRRLPATDQERLLVAAPTERQVLETDAVLAGRLLHRLIENALEACDGDVLIRARHEGTRCVFSVVNRCANADQAPDAAPFHTSKPNRLGLGLAVARREAEALGGSLHARIGPEGSVRATLEVPASPRPQTAADATAETAAKPLVEDAA